MLEYCDLCTIVDISAQDAQASSELHFCVICRDQPRYHLGSGAPESTGSVLAFRLSRIIARMILADSAAMQFGRRWRVLGTFGLDSTLLFIEKQIDRIALAVVFSGPIFQAAYDSTMDTAFLSILKLYVRNKADAHISIVFLLCRSVEKYVFVERTGR